ncbi:sigma-70 family RNA polymerase sigma factor [Tundrisphaera lichenicola]|uniref:sigma-70 family RNA polymerase sigma factor n=1 Tax=Tundrisphaera lichenicola TaxID=2029860 RepID=UPI003EBB036C
MSRGHSGSRHLGQIRTLFEVGFLGNLPDEQLLDRFQSGEARLAELAFATLIERHGPMVLGVCRRVLADSQLAEDAFQATFLVLARRAGSVRDRSALGAWLHRVSRRIATRSKVRSDRRKARERPGSVEVAVDYPNRVELGEIRSVIDEEIDRLNHSQRMPLVLCCLEGLSHEEASARLDWPVGTVKSRLARGRRTLQARLIRRGVAPASAVGAAIQSNLAGAEAAVAVSSSLVEGTSRIIAASVVAGRLTTGVVPAAVAALVREEVGSMIVAKLKYLAIFGLAAVGSAAAVGFTLAGPPTSPKPAVPAVVSAPAQPDSDDAKSDAPGFKLSATGRVVDPEGRPIPGARVILKERAQDRLNELTPERQQAADTAGVIKDTLAETRSDAEGRFQFREVPAPAFSKQEGAGKTYFPWDVVALAPGRGLAWEPLTLQAQRSPITLKLGEEGIIRGRVVEPGGRPVVGARILVNGIDPLGKPDVNGVSVDNRLNLNWSAFPIGATTDADGRFAINGIPRDRVASLVVSIPFHERVFAYAATTDDPQADAIGKTYASGKMIEHRRPVHTGDFTITARRTDHILIGRVVFEADGKPAAKANVLRGMNRLKTDEDGRFRIEGLPAGKMELHVNADGSDAAPFDGVITVPEGPAEFEHEIVLPRGLILKGRVADGKTGAGVEKVLVYYVPKYEADQIPTLFLLSETTDADGRFRMVVPPGRGTLDLRTIPQEFAQPERRSTGQPADPKFSAEIDGKGGQEIEVAEFKLDRGGVVTLRVIDPQGRPVPDAQVDIRDANRGFNQKPGRTDSDGRFQVIGLESGKETVVDILAEPLKLGATIEVTDAGPISGSPEVRLQPLVKISGRVLDEEGKPLGGSQVQLYRDVSYPGQSGRSFGTRVAILDEIGGDGSYTFETAIPGATYNTHVEAKGHATATSNHVSIKPGESVVLDEFRLPTLDQEVKGVVLDTRGQPVAGISVGYQRNDRTQAMYAPQGATWFQDTDLLGRFHLNQLPRGPIRLQVYRHPEGPDRSIRGMQYVDVQPGQDEVRVELRDRNDRLRGID